MRSIIIAAIAAAFALTAASAPAASPGPYKLDAKGKCHDASGRFVKQTLCAAQARPPKHCRDPKTGKFVKCGAPGSFPA